MSDILVVEDDPAQLQGMSAFLRHAGFRVHAASDGTEALVLGARLKPDAAICDWNLGGAPDGAAVMHGLQSALPNLVAIFITGNDLTRLQSQTSDLTSAHYFAKPVAPEQLLQALSAAGCDP